MAGLRTICRRAAYIVYFSVLHLKAQCDTSFPFFYSFIALLPFTYCFTFPLYGVSHSFILLSFSHFPDLPRIFVSHVHVFFKSEWCCAPRRSRRSAIIGSAIYDDFLDRLNARSLACMCVSEKALRAGNE